MLRGTVTRDHVTRDRVTRDRLRGTVLHTHCYYISLSLDQFIQLEQAEVSRQKQLQEADASGLQQLTAEINIPSSLSIREAPDVKHNEMDKASSVESGGVKVTPDSTKVTDSMIISSLNSSMAVRYLNVSASHQRDPQLKTVSTLCCFL